jgi:hypothetical protein
MAMSILRLKSSIFILGALLAWSSSAFAAIDFMSDLSEIFGLQEDTKDESVYQQKTFVPSIDLNADTTYVEVDENGKPTVAPATK